MSATHEHLGLEVLLQDWLGESDPATREAVDEHLMACDSCGALLDELLALGDAIRGAVRAGRVGLVAGPGFLDRLVGRGAHIREYRLAPGASVQCSVAPDDDVLVSRLQAPLQGIGQLDMALELSLEPGVVHRLQDIPFDPAAGEVLFLPSVAQVRRLPAHTLQVTLLERQPQGSREVGRYVFHHSPWSA